MFSKGDSSYFRINSAKTKTLGTIIKSLITYVLYFTAGIMILNVFEVPTGPLLASAGIFGLAISFGSQSLVRDVLTGFFILLEDQFSVSEYVTITGVSGYVEELGLRVTKLRDFTGELHIIPNGLIKQVTNHSRGNMAAVVDVSIAYEEDIDRCIGLLEMLCLHFGGEHSEVLEGPHVLGIQAMGANEVIVRVFAKTVPMKQWDVERELRKEIKAMFDREGVEVPYPRQVLVPFHKRPGGVGQMVQGEDNTIGDKKPPINSQVVHEQRMYG